MHRLSFVKFLRLMHANKQTKQLQYYAHYNIARLHLSARVFIHSNYGARHGNTVTSPRSD